MHLNSANRESDPRAAPPLVKESIDFRVFSREPHSESRRYVQYIRASECTKSQPREYCWKHPAAISRLSIACAPPIRCIFSQRVLAAAHTNTNPFPSIKDPTGAVEREDIGVHWTSKYWPSSSAQLPGELSQSHSRFLAGSSSTREFNR